MMLPDHNEARAYIVMTVTIIGMFVYFHSAWVRGGYMGKDKQLDLFETNRLYIHVIGCMIMLVFEQMVFSTREIAWPAWVIIGSVLGGILGIEVYVDTKKILDKMNKNDKPDL